MNSYSTVGIDRKTLFRWVGWFSLLNYFLIVVFVGRYLKYTNDIEEILQFVYLPGALLGHVSTLIFLPFITIFLPIIIILPKSIVIRTVGVCIATLGCVVLLIDFGVYSQYRFHLNGMVLDFIINGGREIFDLSWSTYAFGIITIIAVILLEIVISHISWKAAKKVF